MTDDLDEGIDDELDDLVSPLVDYTFSLDPCQVEKVLEVNRVRTLEIKYLSLNKPLKIISKSTHYVVASYS